MSDADSEKVSGILYSCCKDINESEVYFRNIAFITFSDTNNYT